MRAVKELLYMNRNEAAQAVNAFPVAVLPLGATEQHGPHMPLGVDLFLAEEISRRVCEKTGAILLPSIPFGYSWVWRDIPGTVTLKQKTMEEVIKNIACGVSRYGVKLLVLINAHDANNSSMKYAVRDLSDEIEMPVLYLFYPGMDKAMKEICESPTWHGMIHACEFETSLMLAVKPELVNMDKAVREYPEKPDLYGKSAISLGSISNSGVFGDATLASREKGEKLLDYFVNVMSDNINTAYDTHCRL